MSGFDTLKDVIQVLIIPLTIFGLGIALPRLFESQRRRTFINLIRRELKEMTPYPGIQKAGDNDPQIKPENNKWTGHLKKRFIHEDIFKNISPNRDFILSLPADLTYYLSQMWREFGKARKLELADDFETKASDIEAHAIQWHYYLWETCRFLDAYGKMPSFSEDSKQDSLYDEIFMQWHELLLHYYPDQKKLKETGGKSSIAPQK